MTEQWGRALVAVGFLVAAIACVASQQDGTVLVRGGAFRMGTGSSELPELKRRYAVSFPGVFEDEVPDHAVTVSDFRMDLYEVTNARFSEFVERHPEWNRAQMPEGLHNGHYLEHWKDGKLPLAKASHPVVYVTWHAAQAFCLWAGGRLPTEAEWEYAARAGRDQEFPWGNEPPSVQRANYSASRVDDTRPVGSYPPNPSPLVGGAIPTDLRTVQGRRVLRGASFGGGDVNLRTRWRDSHEVLNAVAFVGFRCAYPRRGFA